MPAAALAPWCVSGTASLVSAVLQPVNSGRPLLLLWGAWGRSGRLRAAHPPSLACLPEASGGATWLVRCTTRIFKCPRGWNLRASFNPFIHLSVRLASRRRRIPAVCCSCAPSPAAVRPRRYCRRFISLILCALHRALLPATLFWRFWRASSQICAIRSPGDHQRIQFYHHAVRQPPSTRALPNLSLFL